MSDDHTPMSVRERVWVTKIDHEASPPVAVEEVFIENGRIVSVTSLTEAKTEEQTDGSDGQ